MSRVVDVAVYGNEGVRVLSEKHTIRAVFPSFADLEQTRGVAVESPELSCHGHKWTIAIYPRGCASSNKDVEHVSVSLVCKTNAPVKAKFALRMPPRAPAEKTYSFPPVSDYGFYNYADRAEVLDPSNGFLVGGDLTVEADIQIYLDKPPPWIPRDELHLDMLKILESAKRTGDVKFQVGSEEFRAHRVILEARAPVLAALTEGHSSDTLIPIQKVTPSVFRALLRFAYANAKPEPKALQDEASELLEAADYFACKGLKLAAEAEIVASGITVETAAELVILGDAKNCALLKEAATDFFVANPTSIMASSGWDKVKESAPVMAELMEIMFNSEKRSDPIDCESGERGFKHMCVSDLRRKLDEKGLDVDGSKEMLIKRLEKNEMLVKAMMIDSSERGS